MSSLLLQSGISSETKEVRRVLILCELGRSSPAVTLLDRELRATRDQSRYQIERLRRLPDHTFDLYTRIGMDAEGARCIGEHHAGPMVVGAANAPVFGPCDVDLGHGNVGRYLESCSWVSKIIGKIAERVAAEKRPLDISVVSGAIAYMFDWRAFRRWGFRESELPPGSVVLFRGPSLWERTKPVWLASLLVVLCLNVLALYLRLMREKNRQLRLSGMLITAQEKERSRLASEIHDDFSQRMALLVLGLENAEESVCSSPNEAVQQLHSLFNAASEIGADLHTFSHRLHSSTLERLGLVPGVSALCKEFSIRHGIDVDFHADNVPRTVDPDVALCVFRIVQEGLRNLNKYSGAREAKVRLRNTADKLRISICDEGIGFDVREANKKEGLGIRSMEERARLLGGRFEIHSEPGTGTRIEAWVPLQPGLGRATG